MSGGRRPGERAGVGVQGDAAGRPCGEREGERVGRQIGIGGIEGEAERLAKTERAVGDDRKRRRLVDLVDGDIECPCRDQGDVVILRHVNGDGIEARSLRFGRRPLKVAIGGVDGQAGGRGVGDIKSQRVRGRAGSSRDVGDQQQAAFIHRRVGNGIERGQWGGFHAHVVESGGVQDGIVVGADHEADIHGGRQVVADAAGEQPVDPVRRSVAGEQVAVADELGPVGRRVGGAAHVAGAVVVVEAILQIGTVDGRLGHEDVPREIIERLPDHHAGLGPRIRVLE